MDLLIIFLIGLGASFFGSFISGGLSMISIPALLLFGLPPHIALGTYRLGSLGFDAGGLIQFFRNNKIVWKYVASLSIVALVSGWLGAVVVLQIDEALLSKGIGYFLLLILFFVVFKPKFGVEQKNVGLFSKTIGHFTYGIASVYGSSITVGQGMLLTLSNVYFLGLPLLNSIATAKIPSLLTSLAALFVLGLAGVVDWLSGLILMVGMLAGSYIGAHHAIKLGNVLLRRIVIVVITLFSLKLILGL